MALNSLICADVPLRNCSLTHCRIICCNITAKLHRHISKALRYVTLFVSVSALISFIIVAVLGYLWGALAKQVEWTVKIVAKVNGFACVCWL